MNSYKKDFISEFLYRGEVALRIQAQKMTDNATGKMNELNFESKKNT